jgi:hypothetical protein
LKRWQVEFAMIACQRCRTFDQAERLFSKSILMSACDQGILGAQLNKSEHSPRTSRAPQIPRLRQTFAFSNTPMKSSVLKAFTKVVQDPQPFMAALYSMEYALDKG